MDPSELWQPSCDLEGNIADPMKMVEEERAKSFAGLLRTPRSPQLEELLSWEMEGEGPKWIFCYWLLKTPWPSDSWNGTCTVLNLEGHKEEETGLAGWFVRLPFRV